MRGKSEQKSAPLDKEPAPKVSYTGPSAPIPVIKEAKAKKKNGGACEPEAKVMGGKARMRLDRPGRKSGGRVGCDKAPMSSAANTSNPSGHTGDASSDGDD